MPSQGPSSTSAGSGHKRKRSLDDDPVDVGKLYRLKQHMALLREELEGIEETEGELDSVMKQIGNLETILADFEAGSRMLLDAVLLSMAKITSERNTDTSVAILPEMRLTTGDGIVVANPDTNFQAWLTGYVDYGVVQYLDQDDNKGMHASFHVADGRLFLVEAKRMSDKVTNLLHHMPEAVGQAISSASQNTVRFCLSNGHSWIFAILVKDESTGQRTYYESSPKYLDKTVILTATSDTSLNSIQQIVELVLQWVRFLGWFTK
ncbi:hypothetical protein C8J57DRAFT_1074397 [Mycena rebaudengoi]|nr:hypothetical protein C8J57DRAFT_1074397 [Mycena rebaudengoi]